MMCLVPRAKAVNSFLATVKCDILIGQTLGLLEMNTLPFDVTKYTTTPRALSLLSVNACIVMSPRGSTSTQRGIGIKRAILICSMITFHFSKI